MDAPRLQSLHLSGFKTFSSPTHIEFSEGITAVVGANGSGKSNLVDAIRWAIGEQSLRDLRSRKAQDVIFAGTQTRRPAAMAEVRLTFDNDPAWLPHDAIEVELTRRLYRSAEGEYLVNGQRARLRDIGDLVRHGGLEAGGHTIVGQGMVDAVLSLRGIERRAFVAAVAGVAPYEVQRRDALARLKETRENLATGHIVYDEMEPRLRLLKRQANLAQSAEIARQSLEAALRTHYRLAWDRLTKDRDLLLVSLDAHEKQLGEVRSRIEALEQEKRTAEESESALRKERQAVREALIRAEYEFQRASEAHQAGLQRIDHLRHEEEELGRQLQRLATESDDVRWLDEIGRRIERLKREQAELADALTAGREMLQQTRRARDTCERSRVDADRKIRDAATKRRRIEDRLTSTKESHERLEGEISVVRNALPALRTELEQLRTAGITATEHLREAQEAFEQAQNHMTTQLEHSAALRTRQAELTARHQTLERALEQNRAQHDELVRLRPGNPGVILVSEIVHVREELAPVLAVAMGSLLDTPADGMPSEAGLRAGPMPSQAWRDEVLDILRRSDVPIVGWLDEQVSIAGDDATMPAALSSVLVMESDHDLERAWREVSTLPAETIAIPALKLVSRNGTMRQAGSQHVAPMQARESLLRENRIAALDRELDLLEANIEQAGLDTASATEELVSAVQGLEQAEAQVHRANKTVVSLATEQQQLDERARLVQSRLERQENDAKRLTEARQRLSAEIESEANALSHVDAQLASHEQELQRVERELQETSGAVVRMEDQIREKESSRHLIDRQLEIDTQEQKRLLAVRRRHEADHRERTARLDSVATELEAATAGTTETKAALQRSEAELMQAKSAMEQRADVGDEKALSSRYATEIGECHRRLEKTVGEVETLRTEIRHVQESLQRLAEDAEREVGRHPSELSQAVDQSPLGELEIRRLRIRAEQAGEVEPGVLEEYRQLSAEREVLGAQLEDLRSASDELEGLLAHADREVRRRFSISFARVNILFQEYMQQIFGGGKGELVLESLDGADSIEILAQLPGKRARDLSGLSGGERTLVAGAFLFALLSAAPPPFCVLDEVDAALDETNVDRYLAVLRSLATTTQFVVVTHNRATMAAANSLYGIVLDAESGSRALSIRLDEALAS